MAYRLGLFTALDWEHGIWTWAQSLSLYTFSWYFMKPPSQRPASPSRESNQYQQRNAPIPNSKTLPCFEVTWPRFWKDPLGPWSAGSSPKYFLSAQMLVLLLAQSPQLRNGPKWVISHLSHPSLVSILKGFSPWYQSKSILHTMSMTEYVW